MRQEGTLVESCDEIAEGIEGILFPSWASFEVDEVTDSDEGGHRYDDTAKIPRSLETLSALLRIAVRIRSNPLCVCLSE